MKILQRLINKRTFQYRDVASDVATIAETLGGQHPFLRNAPIQDGDVVLDLGAYIGMFAVTVASTAKMIVCYEPNKDNFELLRLNVKLYPNIIYGNKTVVGDPSINEVEFYPASGNNFLTGSVFGKRSDRSYTVEADHISEIMDAWNPTYIRCDLEGSEYDLFGYLRFPDYVRVVALEAHFGKIIWRERMYPQLVSNMRRQGFSVHYIISGKYSAQLVASRSKQ